MCPPVGGSEREIAALFAVAQARWRASLHAVDLAERVRELSDDEPFTALYMLREVRKRGQLLRSAWVLLSAEGRPPAALQEVLVALGKVKDAKTRKKRAPRVARLDRALAAFDPRALPSAVAPPIVVAARFGAEIADIAQELAATRTDEKRLHELRKSVRRIGHLFGLARGATKRPRVPKSAVRALRDLSRWLSRRISELRVHTDTDLSLSAEDRERLATMLLWAAQQTVGASHAPPTPRARH